MSNLIATISKIESCDNLHIIYFNFNGQSLTMMSLELDINIKVGSTVKLSIKPTHIGIGKNISGDLSYSNQLNSIIVSIEKGKLLSSIILKLEDNSNTTLESIITKKSVQRLDLKENDKITAIIKASDISILKGLDD
jgi:molybdopterin-binding protein